MTDSIPPKPKAGCPRGKEEDVRSRRTVTFLTRDEYRQLELLALEHRLSISSVAHKLLVKSLQSEVEVEVGVGVEIEADKYLNNLPKD